MEQAEEYEGEEPEHDEDAAYEDEGMLQSGTHGLSASVLRNLRSTEVDMSQREAYGSEVAEYERGAASEEGGAEVSWA